MGGFYDLVVFTEKKRVGTGASPAFHHNLHSGCPSLVAFFATGWGSCRRTICSVRLNRSRFRAVHCDSITTMPSTPLA